MALITQAARALEVVARYGSIRRAAERINAAPSAVNRQILNLEAEFGTPLFERLPRGMRLTQAGQLLVDQIREWQRDQSRAHASLDALKDAGGGDVRIGAMECLAAEFLPRAFRELQKSDGNATLHAVSGGTDDIAARLVSGEIDLAVAFNMPRDSGLKIMHEVRMELGAVMPPDHPLAAEDEVQIGALFEHPLILADSTLTIGPVVDAMLERSRKSRKGSVTTNSVTMLKAMVRQGMGVSLLTSADVYSEVRSRQLHFAPIAGARMFELLSVSTRDIKTLNPNARKMAEIVSSALDALSSHFPTVAQPAR